MQTCCSFRKCVMRNINCKIMKFKQISIKMKKQILFYFRDKQDPFHGNLFKGKIYLAKCVELNTKTKNIDLDLAFIFHMLFHIDLMKSPTNCVSRYALSSFTFCSHCIDDRTSHEMILLRANAKWRSLCGWIENEQFDRLKRLLTASHITTLSL